MQKFFSAFILFSVFSAALFAAPVNAEDVQPAEPAAPAAEETVPAAAESAVGTAATAELPSSENLEFVSGEITKVDEIAKSITVKLYGETEDEASEKILTVSLDENTDITDGEKDRDLKSLTASTEVDVEYDPASNKATYIFVY